MYRTYSRLPSLHHSPCPYCRIEPDLLANTCQTVWILVGGTNFTFKTVAPRYVEDDVADMGGGYMLLSFSCAATRLLHELRYGMSSFSQASLDERQSG
jgi:hypothetical protein